MSVLVKGKESEYTCSAQAISGLELGLVGRPNIHISEYQRIFDLSEMDLG